MSKLSYDISLYYDDFQIGDTYETPSRTITESDVMLFAGLTGDYVELHTSREYAKNSRWGQPIVHGMLTLSISYGLNSLTGIFKNSVVASLEQDHIKDTAPVFFGDTIHNVTTITDKRVTSKPQYAILKRHTDVVNQHGTTVLQYDSTLMIKTSRS
jgi:acyl dehydratase